MKNSKMKFIFILCVIFFVSTVTGSSDVRFKKVKVRNVMKLKRMIISEVNSDECYGLGTNTSRGFEVVGSNFGANPGNTKVFLNNVSIQFSNAFWSDFTIQVCAPESVVKLGVKNVIYLKNNNVLCSNKKSFIPWGFVQDVTPNHMSKRKADFPGIKKYVKIRAYYLGGTQGSYKIYFGKTEVTVVSWKQNNPPVQIIRVSIPQNLQRGKHVVRVKRNGKWITNPALNTPIFEYK